MINQQTLEFIRDEILQSMFCDVRTKGQLDYDGSMITETSKYSRRHGDDGLPVECVRSHFTRSFKRSSCPLPPNIFHLNHIGRALRELPSDLRPIATFTYSEKCDWDSTQALAQTLWSRFLEKSMASRSRAFSKKKTEQLRGMVFLAMQNWKENTLHERDAHTPQRVRELLNVSEANWVRDWRPQWRLMHQILSEMDEKVLVNVFKKTGKDARDQAHHESA